MLTSQVYRHPSQAPKPTLQAPWKGCVWNECPDVVDEHTHTSWEGTNRNFMKNNSQNIVYTSSGTFCFLLISHISVSRSATIGNGLKTNRCQLIYLLQGQVSNEIDYFGTTVLFGSGLSLTVNTFELISYFL